MNVFITLFKVFVLMVRASIKGAQHEDFRDGLLVAVCSFADGIKAVK